MATITYNFEIADQVFVVNTSENSIKTGVVQMFSAKVYATISEPATYAEYQIKLSDDSVVRVLPDKVFSTFEEASAYLGNVI